MRLAICGARGSTPVSGQDFVRYGGNTPCVAVLNAAGEPSLVIDAGTGIRNLARLASGRPLQGTILLTHLHWDHVQGLPFCAAADCDQARVTLVMPAQGDPVSVLERVMSPPFFPIGPTELRGDWAFVTLEPGAQEFEGLSVVAAEVPHKGGRTFGYRISDGSSTFTYISDHNPSLMGPGENGLGQYHDAALALCEGSDLLLHDSQYTAAEFPGRSSWGHSAVEYAVGLAAKGGVGRLLMFHHDPSRTDDAIDELVRANASDVVSVKAAAEGDEIEI